MRFLISIALGLITACSFNESPQFKNKDIFEKVFHLKKSQNFSEVTSLFGIPKGITRHESEPEIDNYYFEKSGDNPSINIFVDRKTKVMKSFAITFWADVDGYDYMKERFKGYKWIETELPSKAIDYVEEMNRVEIPELGIVFDYDNQDPLRRPMWIIVK